jgi:uncharacterized membrane protein (DUF106 family)
MQNKKLNIEYEKLNKDFSLIKNEKEKMIHELEEQKANLFNFQKELSKNKSKKIQNQIIIILIMMDIIILI